MIGIPLFKIAMVENDLLSESPSGQNIRFIRCDGSPQRFPKAKNTGRVKTERLKEILRQDVGRNGISKLKRGGDDNGRSLLLGDWWWRIWWWSWR